MSNTFIASLVVITINRLCFLATLIHPSFLLVILYLCFHLLAYLMEEYQSWVDNRIYKTIVITELT